MTTKEFHTFITILVKKIFQESKILPASLFAPLPNGNLLHCAKGFENNDDKQSTLNMYATILAVQQIQMYSFASEAWMARENPGPFVAPSQRSDRQECLFILTCDKQNNHYHTMLKVERTPDKVQLIQSDTEIADRFDDRIKLFDRVDNSKLTKHDLKKIAKEYELLEKPSWYNEIIME